jgi:hypothetical protein
MRQQESSPLFTSELLNYEALLFALLDTILRQ